jgi:hypothetical protein
MDHRKHTGTLCCGHSMCFNCLTSYYREWFNRPNEFSRVVLGVRRGCPYCKNNTHESQITNDFGDYRIPNHGVYVEDAVSLLDDVEENEISYKAILLCTALLMNNLSSLYTVDRLTVFPKCSYFDQKVFLDEMTLYFFSVNRALVDKGRNFTWKIDDVVKRCKKIKAHKIRLIGAMVFVPSEHLPMERSEMIEESQIAIHDEGIDLMGSVLSRHLRPLELVIDDACNIEILYDEHGVSNLQRSVRQRVI